MSAPLTAMGSAMVSSTWTDLLQGPSALPIR